MSDDGEVRALRARPLGVKREKHHLVPKSFGGRETVAVHPIRHRAIHACLDGKSPRDAHDSIPALRARPEISRFLRWFAGKPPDFHQPTRRSARRRYTDLR